MRQGAELIDPSSPVVHELGDEAMQGAGIALPEANLSMTNVEVTNNGVELSIGPERLDARVEAAVEACDFEPTPQLSEGLKDYFDTNYKVAATVESLLDEDPQAMTADDRNAARTRLQHHIEQLADEGRDWGFDVGNLVAGNMPQPISRLMESGLAKLRLERLEKPEDVELSRAEIMLLATAARGLFAEASVGVTTVAEPEKALLEHLSERILDRVQTSGLFEADGRMKDVANPRSVALEYLKDPILAVTEAQTKFWQDTRFAGQLLFHNSPNMPQTRAEGRLLPRRMQLARNGTLSNFTSLQNNNGDLHSPMVHWSEMYDPDGYKSIDQGGTIAMSLGEIIDVAPIARDAEYGRLRLKPERANAIKKRISVTSSVGSIGAGGSDGQGAGGSDRTFYSSAHDVEPNAPLETAPDGHEFRLSRQDIAIVRSEAEAITAQQSGLGDSFPTVKGVGFRVFDAFNTEKPVEAPSIQDDIARLQAESISRWPDELIVPVRAGGVMDFYIPDDARLSGRTGAKFPALAA